MTTTECNREQCAVTRESIRERFENARTEEEREDTVDNAIELGMRLDEIEKYLDWLETSPDASGPKPLQ